MVIKRSGIVMLSSLILLVVVCGYVFGPRAHEADDIVLPSYLAETSANRYPVVKARLTAEWSKSVPLPGGFASESLPLEDNTVLEVRCNQDNSYMYTVDSLGILRVNGKVARMGSTRFCDFLEVRAANPESIGKAYVVSFVR